MNTDADYSYSEPAPSYSAASPSIQLPFAILCCAVAMIMIMQTQGSFRQKDTLREQKLQMTELYGKREPLVKKASELKAQLNAIVIDLLILGKTDEDAKAIIAKYNIQQNQPSSAPGGEAPAGDATPK